MVIRVQVYVSNLYLVYTIFVYTTIVRVWRSLMLLHVWILKTKIYLWNELSFKKAWTHRKFFYFTICFPRKSSWHTECFIVIIATSNMSTNKGKNKNIPVNEQEKIELLAPFILLMTEATRRIKKTPRKSWKSTEIFFRFIWDP